MQGIFYHAKEGWLTTKFYLVDLAGSERLNVMESTGQLFKGGHERQQRPLCPKDRNFGAGQQQNAGYLY
ncbi:hypothetical protein Trydic_g15981 [Trypoxylus dichotomus]